MKRRLRDIFCFSLLSLSLCSIANDGAYLGGGGNLIPITDSSISVQKEILKVTRVDGNFIEVDVYYEFYNDGDAKELLIGFEATSPSGDVSTIPKNGEHPYMTNFSVNVNNQELPYDVAIVEDSIYYSNGRFNTVPNNRRELDENFQYVDFFYVYHFTCTMKKGLNIIKHRYRNELSGSIGHRFLFDYVLSAANRWKGGRIGDFTLELDFGDFEEFNVNTTFFSTTDNWFCKENCKMEIRSDDLPPYMEPNLYCILRDGLLVFKQRDFEPNGDLQVISYSMLSGIVSFDYRTNWLKYPIDLMDYFDNPIDEESKRILKNLPFARRGYVFKTDYIQKYFEGLNWYVPHKDYLPKMNSLTPKEQEWVARWSK